MSSSAAAVPDSTKRSTLYLQVLAAIAAGVAVGALKPSWGLALQPLGEGFIGLIRMLITPIVFATVSVGIAGMGDLRRVGRVGAKAILYFEVMTTVALILGLLVVELLKPGEGIHAQVAALDTTQLDRTLAEPRPHGIVEHLQALIPTTVFSPFAKGDVLQVLVLAILSGLALAGLRERGKPILTGLEHLTTLCFAVISLVMRFAPLGAFGAMAFTIGKFGLGALGNLAMMLVSFYVTALLFVFVVLSAVLRAVGLSLPRLLRYLKDELVVVLATSSSESALPSLMTKLEALGCAGGVVRLVVPTGYSFNLDGTCIYLTMASVFVAQALDVHLTLGDELSLLAVLLLTSKGAAGVTGSGLLTLSATLESTGRIPVAGVSMLMGVDRFMSEARALTNLVGNAVATLVVARWEGALDLNQARAQLAKPSNVGVTS